MRLLLLSNVNVDVHDIKVVGCIYHLNHCRGSTVLNCKCPRNSLFFAGWIFICLIRLLFWTKAESHWLHLCDFSPVWVFRCLLKPLASIKAYLHCLHLCDFSPEWDFRCVFKRLAQTVAKSHWVHLCDFSLEWVFKCPLKVSVCADAPFGVCAFISLRSGLWYSHWLQK